VPLHCLGPRRSKVCSRTFGTTCPAAARTQTVLDGRAGEGRPVIDAMSQAALAAWFKSQDRQTLKHAIENEETPEERAKRLIRERGQSAVNRFWEVRSGDSPW
jgi:16S rRNA G966 N2-methylase RsmD